MDEVDEKLMSSLGLYPLYKKMQDTINQDKLFINRMITENRALKELLSEIESLLTSGTNKDVLEKIATTLDKHR